MNSMLSKYRVISHLQNGIKTILPEAVFLLFTILLYSELSCMLRVSNFNINIKIVHIRIHTLDVTTHLSVIREVCLNQKFVLKTSNSEHGLFFFFSPSTTTRGKVNTKKKNID